MSFQDPLAWLSTTQFFGIKLGLENTLRLLDALGNPHHHLPAIHVAGTNGKGSVCAFLDSILRSHHLSSGLYTSPHLANFRERIRVRGKMISVECVDSGLREIRAVCDVWEHYPTFFEITTALAMSHFHRVSTDLCILETGMGGRLDATNVILPKVSVITPIAMDHSEWLGDTIAKIAAEKAGIIKPGVPVVSAPQCPEAEAVLRRRAAECGSEIRFVEAPWSGSLGLKGAHQTWNAALAVLALEVVGFPMQPKALADGLQNVIWPGRFQAVGSRILVDGAHNPHAAACLVEAWREEFGNERPTIIFGAMSDKDHASMLDTLSQIAGEFYFTPVNSPRSADPAALAAKVNGRIFPSLTDALEAAEKRPARILITGSLFLAGEALEFLNALEPEPA